MNLYSCNDGIWFLSPGTCTCGLGLLWVWMVHEIACATGGERSLTITVSTN